VPFATGVALLEREHELGAVRNGVERACAGEGALLLVEGPPGIGKTELMREARGAAAPAGVTVLEARGSELEQPFAFGIVRQLLEPVSGTGDGEADLFTGAAAPAARLFRGESPGPSGSDADFDALHSLYWLVVNLADRAPVLVSVDDCQWADLESLQFLSYLSQRIEGLRVAILLAGRSPDGAASDEAGIWGQILSRPDAVALYPRMLSERAAATLTRERLGSDADEEFCRACHIATGGNPLFLRELLGALASAGVAPSADAASEVQAVGPAAVARFVLHRVAALGPSASALATAVAVLGDDSDLQLVADVAGLSESEARAAADDLVRANIFARSARLGFVHPIVRAALYEDLAPGQRQARHAAAAEALARLGASPERVTAHLLLTGPTGERRRIETLRAAAAAAAGRGAPLAAAARLTRALAESPAEQERAEILADLGRYELAAMRFDAADEHLRAAVSSDAAAATRADAAASLARCSIVFGRSAELTFAALSSLAEEFATPEPERSLELGCDLLMLATGAPGLRSELGALLERFHIQAQARPQFEAVARIHAALEQVLRGESVAAAADEVEAAVTDGLPAERVTLVGLVAVDALRRAERYELPLRMLDLALEEARRQGHAARQGLIHGQRAAIALARGSLHDAQVEAETGLRLVQEQHFVFRLLLAVAIVVHMERGELDAADKLVERADALGVVEEHVHLEQHLIARGRLGIAHGRIREGVSDLLWCGQRLEAMGLRWPSEWRVRAVPALVELGQGERAQALASEQLSVARQAGVPGSLGMALRAAASVAGGEDSLALLEEAISVLEASSAQLELAYALADLGAALNRIGRRREGRETERRALELAERCGAVVLAEAARAELQAGPGRRARIELTGPNALTAAEYRVCRQAADGHTNREIAQTLFVTEKTVERHLSSAYQKLGVRSRFQLPAAIEKR
jgi:DNA-binding CsgD family transcriptional regulator